MREAVMMGREERERGRGGARGDGVAWVRGYVDTTHHRRLAFGEQVGPSGGWVLLDIHPSLQAKMPPARHDTVAHNKCP